MRIDVGAAAWSTGPGVFTQRHCFAADAVDALTRYRMTIARGTSSHTWSATLTASFMVAGAKQLG